MTSNAGSTDKSTGVGFNRTAEEISKERAMKALREFLRPEFLSRIDEVICFRPLTEENYADIAGLMLDEMRTPLEEKAITLEYDREALQKIAAEAFGRKYGAREIRRVIRDHVEDAIAEEMIDKGTQFWKIVVTTDENGVVVQFS